MSTWVEGLKLWSNSSNSSSLSGWNQYKKLNLHYTRLISLRGYTTLWHNHFARTVLLWPFLVLPFCCYASPFWIGRFWRENNFFLFPIFFLNLYYFFPSFFFHFFQNSRLFIFNKFLSTLHKKKYKFKHTATVFYSFIPGTDKINSWIFHELILTVKISV